MKTILDFDDLCDGNDRLDLLLRLKEMKPDFKVTLFAIPLRCSDQLLATYDCHRDWIELGIHGWQHARHECLAWTSEETQEKVEQALAYYRYAPVFKAPNWETCDELYTGLKRAQVGIADHTRNIEIMPGDIPHYIYNVRLRNDAYNRQHGHIQNWDGSGLEEGFDKYAKLQGPFAFISEVLQTRKELAV